MRYGNPSIPKIKVPTKNQQNQNNQINQRFRQKSAVKKRASDTIGDPIQTTT
jgi:hypothetical protein